MIAGLLASSRRIPLSPPLLLLLLLLKGIPRRQAGGWRRAVAVALSSTRSKSRVYKLMHVKSPEQNRPACIMERNAVRSARPAGQLSGLAPPSPGAGVRGQRAQLRGESSEVGLCDIINRYDVPRTERRYIMYNGGRGLGNREVKRGGRGPSTAYPLKRRNPRPCNELFTKLVSFYIIAHEKCF